MRFFFAVKITHWSDVNLWSGHPALPSPTDGYAIVQRPGTKQNVPEASEVPTEVPEEDRGRGPWGNVDAINTNVAWEPTTCIFRACKHPYFLV